MACPEGRRHPPRRRAAARGLTLRRRRGQCAERAGGNPRWRHLRHQRPTGRHRRVAGRGTGPVPRRHALPVPVRADCGRRDADGVVRRRLRPLRRPVLPGPAHRIGDRRRPLVDHPQALDRPGVPRDDHRVEPPPARRRARPAHRGRGGLRRPVRGEGAARQGGRPVPARHRRPAGPRLPPGVLRARDPHPHRRHHLCAEHRSAALHRQRSPERRAVPDHRGTGRVGGAGRDPTTPDAGHRVRPRGGPAPARPAAVARAVPGGRVGLGTARCDLSPSGRRSGRAPTAHRHRARGGRARCRAAVVHVPVRSRQPPHQLPGPAVRSGPRRGDPAPARPAAGAARSTTSATPSPARSCTSRAAAS